MVLLFVLKKHRYELERPEKGDLFLTNVPRFVNSISRRSTPYRFHVARSLCFTTYAFCVFRDAPRHIDFAFVDLRTLQHFLKLFLLKKTPRSRSAPEFRKVRKIVSGGALGGSGGARRGCPRVAGGSGRAEVGQREILVGSGHPH